jgi:predicted peptidase
MLGTLAGLASHAQDFSTHTYFDKDTIPLKLDLFLPVGDSAQHLIIFVHGGGFAQGSRQDGHSFARYMQSQGVAVATLEYTLYMKDKSFSCDGYLNEKIRAIQLAANDVWAATYFLENLGDSLSYGFDQIFLAGSSAGAETVLHASYWDRRLMGIKDHCLPENFAYSGVIAGAGAIMDLNLIRPENAIPTFLFHGDQDTIVPYASAAHHYCQHNATGWLMLFGSRSLFDHMVQLDKSVSLISFEGCGHACAGTLFTEDRIKILEFIKDVSTDKLLFQSHLILKQ